MAEAGGCPSKKPRLVRHPVPGSAGQSSQNVHRHQVFAIQPTGQINLETRYLDAVLPVDNASETAYDVSADCCETDPWNETYISLDTEPHDIYVLAEKQKQMVKVSDISFFYSTKPDFCIVFFHDRTIQCAPGPQNDRIT
jgi:hypothetical protein